MDVTELAIEQIPNEQGGMTTTVTAAGCALIGVESVNIGGDERGSYIDIRVRQFRIGSLPQTGTEEDAPAPEEPIAAE